MAAAFKVNYRGPNGDCPTAVLIFPSPEECVSELAEKIKNKLVSARGGEWKNFQVVIRSIEYIGPWFAGEKLYSDAAATTITNWIRDDDATPKLKTEADTRANVRDGIGEEKTFIGDLIDDVATLLAELKRRRS